MSDARGDAARAACSDVGAHTRHHTRHQSALPLPPPLPPLRALRPRIRPRACERERGRAIASARERGGEEIEIMNDVRGDAACIVTNIQS